MEVAKRVVIVAAGLVLAAATTVSAQSFGSSGLPVGLANPTSLQFGPDGRLYVSQQNGEIFALGIERKGADDYVVATSESISLIRTITNHDDDGTPCSGGCDTRQVTGILVTGSAAQPVLYVTSSDSRISVSQDSGLDTNSGVISRLTCVGPISEGVCQQWDHVDIVRGLPRSEENHSTNGMSLDAAANVLYVASGGNTNKGAPSDAFSGTPETYLAAAILAVDLDAIAAIESANGGPYIDQRTGARFVYDLVTLDDPTRANIDNTHPDFPYAPGHPRYGLAVDPGDPFGGNNGLNQAVPEPGGPVQLHSPGYRNAFDVLHTSDGELYTWDNGPNSGWGGSPFIYDAGGTKKGWASDPAVDYDPAAGDWCSNEINEQGSETHGDGLKHIAAAGYYGGHPTPIRAFPNDSGVRNFIKGESGHWEQVGPVYTLAELLPAGYGLDAGDFPDNPVECAYTATHDALETITSSTNGLAEYTASNFEGAMQGDLLAASFNGNVYRCKRDGSGGLVDLPGSSSGTTEGLCEVLFGGFGSQPLDVTAQGDGELFPGTIWLAAYGTSSIVVFEPQDFTECDPTDPAGDGDGDGYSNGDEADNGTNPCSAGSKPADHDGDFVSDLNDEDDDGDGIPDVEDPFALDADNGLATSLPLFHPLFNNDPGTGLFGLGFTGLMLPGDGATTWLQLFDEEQLAAGGAIGRLTVETVEEGDAYLGRNDQRYGFLFGVDVDSNSPRFVVHTRLVPPYFEIDGAQATPQPYQSYGLFIGTGHQDAYLKLVLNHGNTAGEGGVQALLEDGDAELASRQHLAADWGGADILSAPAVDLYLVVDPATATVRTRISLDQGATVQELGAPIAIPPAWLDPDDGQGLAVGTIATAAGPDGATAPSFGASWDFFSVDFAPAEDIGAWLLVDEFDQVREEAGFVQAGTRFLVLGGRGSAAVRSYEPASGAWTDGAGAPLPLHDFQAVALDGLVYAIGAFTGPCCDEAAVDRVYIYDPVADRWSAGPPLPQGRARGAAAAVAVGGRIFLLGGNASGHAGAASAAVDVYDPANASFTALADMPRARDHFHALHRNGKIYAVGGRDPASGELAPVDVYEIATDSWSTLPGSADLPTPRAGAAVGLLGGELVVAGGESAAVSGAHGESEAFDFASGSWRTLSPMRTPRHGAQAIVSNGGLYLVGGANGKGGANGAVLDLEGLFLAGQTAPAGTTIEAGIASAPDAAAFGQVEIGEHGSATVQVMHEAGTQSVLVTGVAVQGSDAFELVDPPALPFVIVPGSSRGFGLRYAPADSAQHTATLELALGDGGTLEVALSGEGVEPPPVADLSVALTADRDPVAAGAALMYTLVVSNAGPDAATDVRAEITLSPWLDDPATVGCSGDPTGVPTCPIGTLEAGAERVLLVNVDVSPDAAGELIDSAVSVNATEHDPHGSGNADATSTLVVDDAPDALADLRVHKRSDHDPGDGGGGIVYTIVVDNLGPDPVAGASVADLVPEDLVDVQWTCSAADGAFCMPSGSGLIDEHVDLPAGAAVTFTMTATLLPGTDAVINTAVVNPPPEVTDPEPDNNESTDETRVRVFGNGFEPAS